MKTRDYRRLRQVELIHFFVRKYGRKNWRRKLAEAMGVRRSMPSRWLLDDWGGKIQDKMEAWAEEVGFKSHYSDRLKEFHFHVILLHQLLAPAIARRMAIDPRGGPTAMLPFKEHELEEVFAAFGLDSRAPL